jgi:L-lactate dehydrogenase complex protein LldG
MADSVDARTAILSGIRSALGSANDEDRIASEYAGIARAYTHAGTLGREARLELFVHRLREYDAGVSRVSSDGISGEVARVLNARACQRIVIPEGVPAEWLPHGFRFETAAGFDGYELDSMDGVLTGCTVAIAETGSIVLQHAPAQGPRILSLVPDYHLCVVFADQVVETVPESFAQLEATSSLPTTFFSGPSATADIEMTRIKGVHGPRFLDVVLVG